MSADLLLVFTKPARPGRVKTRLIGALSAAEAAELHAAFRDDLCERLRQGDFDLEIAWALDEGEDAPAAGVCGALPARRQCGADLGARLYNALADGARDHDAVAAVGSDHPELSPTTVEEAFAGLRRGNGKSVDLVLGPVPDGGYFLIAARRDTLHAELFTDIAWSTDSVLEATLERARNLGLAVELLPMGQDVDRPDDLEALAARLATSAPDFCPRTRMFLQTRISATRTSLEGARCES